MDPEIRGGIEAAIRRLETWLDRYGQPVAVSEFSCGPGMLGPDGELTTATRKTIQRLRLILDER